MAVRRKRRGRSERFALTNTATQTNRDRQYKAQAGAHFEESSGTTLDKLNAFPRFVSRQALSAFLAKHEIFRRILGVHGDVIECGVFMGAGLFTWAQLSAIYEPVNHGRRIVGFDTFSGFPRLSAKDRSMGIYENKRRGAYRYSAVNELKVAAGLFDLNRPLGHIAKMTLVRGNAVRTMPAYLKRNPHLVVALLYLDFDLYEPTAAALRLFLSRMPRGAVVAFDELNQKQWPGETRAVMDAVGLGRLRIRRFPFTPAISYAAIE